MVFWKKKSATNDQANPTIASESKPVAEDAIAAQESAESNRVGWIALSLR